MLSYVSTEIQQHNIIVLSTGLSVRKSSTERTLVSSSMEPAASSFASERSVSGQADTAVSLTPSDILKLFVTLRGSCLEDSNPR